jgi:hypothetical protein
MPLGRPGTDRGAKGPADNSLDKNRLKAPQGLAEIRELTETHRQGGAESLPARKDGFLTRDMATHIAAYCPLGATPSDRL